MTQKEVQNLTPQEDNELFSPDTNFMPGKEEIDVFSQQINNLSKTLEALKNTTFSNKTDVRVFVETIKGINFAYENQLAEIRFDILKEFEMLPEYQKWFKLLQDTEKTKDEKDLEFKKIQLYTIPKTEWIRKLERLMKLEAKHLQFNALLKNIMYNSLIKVYQEGEIKPVIVHVPAEKIPQGKRIAIDRLVHKISITDLVSKYNKPPGQISPLISKWKKKLEEEGLLQASVPS